MKIFFALILFASGALLSGCATGKNVVLDTVGPAPAQTLSANSNEDTLMVYSAYEVNADFNARDPNRPEYSDYKIFSADGKILRRVHNNSGTILQDPAQIKLPAGKYRVVARANGYGYVTVPIIIEAKQNTILHLEGGDAWPDESLFNQTNAVCLPDGQIIGWKNASDSLSSE